MTATFPAHLYCRYMKRTWNEGRRRHYNEFETDSGASLRSKIPGSAKTDCTFDLHVTAEEFSDLEAFYVNDCAEGSVGFYMEHPRRKTAMIFQWAEAPKASELGSGIYLVSPQMIMD